MVLVLIAGITLLFFVLRFNIFTYIFSLCLVLALFLNISFEQLQLLVRLSLKRVVSSDDILVIPFYLLLAQLLIKGKVFDNVFQYILSLRMNRFFRYYLIFILLSTFLPSSVFANHYMVNFLKKRSSGTLESKICFSQFFSIFNFIGPVSIPILLYTYLMRLPLKNTIISFYILASVIFFLGYVFILKKVRLDFDKKHLCGTDIIFYITILAIFYYVIFIPETVLIGVSIVLLLTTIYLFVKRRINVRLIALATREAIYRSGVIVSILILLFLMNILIIYGNIDVLISNLFISIFSNKYLIIVVLFFVAFIFLQFIDPLAILIIFYPFYNILINEYDFNRYIFGAGYLLFISLGFYSIIKNLVLEIYVKKFDVNYIFLGNRFLEQMLLIALSSLLLMVWV